MKAILAAVAAGFLAGCVISTPIERLDAAPDPASAYIASAVQTRSGMGYAFYMKNVDTNADLTLQIADPYPLGKRIFDDENTPPQVHAIKVLPGRYALTGWAAFTWGVHERLIHRHFDEPNALSQPFEVKAGAIGFLGKFITTTDTELTTWSTRTIHYRILPDTLSEQTAHDLFVQAYPAFGEREFACIFCAL
uniref:hypothetical protein n=1 Tax=Burkholderia sp. Ac-20379 TaxID=2703900 RepID=UPI00197D9A12